MTRVSGRGATRNGVSARFGLPDRCADGDWLDAREDIDGPFARLRTTVTVEHPKTILARNNSPDIVFDRSINAYRGCEHGCIYCFARPTHAYHDLSPGLDFESKLFAKPDAPRLLIAELSKRGYRRITRDCIEILRDCRHPLIITTKSDRVLRDLDLLSDMARDGLVAVGISVTSLDPQIARTLEPRAPRPGKRLEAIRRLAEAGIPAHVNVAPVIPAITDHEMETILTAAAEAGARSASFIPVRLPHEVAPLFRAWLETHFPDRASKVMSIINELRGGRDNDPEFGSRMRGQGVWAELLRTRFRKACARHGLNMGERIVLRTDLFRPPAGEQMELF